jgi:hypothetical protein
MNTEAVAGLIGFVVFFGLWVIVPSVIQKRHQAKKEE